MQTPESPAGSCPPSPGSPAPAPDPSRAATVQPASIIPPDPLDAQVEAQMRQMTRRSFTWGAAAALAGLGGWGWVRSRPADDRLPWPLRRALEFNERLGQSSFNSSRLAPEFPLEQAAEPKVNGRYGLAATFRPQSWSLTVSGLGKSPPRRSFTLDEIKTLPRVELVTELKCVEGWSKVVRWAGVRFADFAALCRLATRSGQPPDLADRPLDLLPYVGLRTPDRKYYVGLDMAGALHPQTLLCYEMNGQPLTLEHGAPLRLVTAVHYGFKSIKRIGTIEFTDQRPSDYWAERGYDWYAGL